MKKDTNGNVQIENTISVPGDAKDVESAKRDRNTHLLLVAWSVLLEDRRRGITTPPTVKDK